MLLYFLINSHCYSWRYFVLWELGKLGAIFWSLLSVFIWIGELSKGSLVNKVNMQSSDSSSQASPGTTYLGEKQIGECGVTGEF